MENPLVASSKDVCDDLDRFGATYMVSANDGKWLLSTLSAHNFFVSYAA